jgi:hypothetical protein
MATQHCHCLSHHSNRTLSLTDMSWLHDVVDTMSQRHQHTQDVVCSPCRVVAWTRVHQGGYGSGGLCRVMAWVLEMCNPMLVSCTLTYLFIPFSISVLFSALKHINLSVVFPFMATRHTPMHAKTFISHCLQNIQFCFCFFSSFVYLSWQKKPLSCIQSSSSSLFFPSVFYPWKDWGMPVLLITILLLLMFCA